MTRARPLPFAIEIGTAHANWLPVEVRLGTHRERISASGVTVAEPVSALLQLGSLALLGRDDTATVQLWCEPSGFWLVAEMQHHRVDLELTFTESMFPGRPHASRDATERAIASCTLGRVPFALVIWRSVRRAERLLREAWQAGQWRHELPARELESLGCALSERGALRRT